MRLRYFAVLLLACCMTIGFLGCNSAASISSIPTKTMPSGATFSGLWYTNFGDMKITVNPDGTARGTFDYKTGGEFEGEVRGGVLIFTWIQPGDFQVGRREVRGKAYLIISDDGLKMKGKWGYGENYSGGGEWHGDKATQIYR